MAHLYGETPEADASTLKQHLETCPECQAQLSAWRDTMKALDEWQLPKTQTRRQPRPTRRFWRMAAAAVLVAGVGFGLGRLAAPPVDLNGLRAQLEPALRQEITREMDARMASFQEQNQAALAALAQANDDQRQADRQADRQANLHLIRERDLAYAAELAAVRRDLETVAVLTDGSLRNAQNQIVRLANLARAGVPGDGR